MFKRSLKNFWLGFIFWIMLVSVLSLLPSNYISHGKGLDKIAHLLFYLPLILITLYHPKRGIMVVGLVALFGVNFGFLLELIQRRIPGRSFDWMDFIMEIIGLGIGLLIIGFWQGVKRKNNGNLRENKPQDSKDI